MPFVTIDEKSCKNCGTCAEVCPNKVPFINDSGRTGIRKDRLHLCFGCGQCMAVCSACSIVVDGLSFEKDFFSLTDEKDHDEKAFFNLISTRRAVRNFKEKPVPRELLEKIVEAVSFAPPGFPPVKTKLVVVCETEKIRQALPYMTGLYEKLVHMMGNPLFRFFIRQETGRRKFKTMRDHLIPALKSRMPGLKKGTEDTLTRYAPAMILFVADKNGEDISQDAYIAATYAMLAMHSLGLGGSIMDIIPPAIEKVKELRKMFRIGDNEEIITSVIIGYPKYRYLRGIKRHVKEVRWM